MWFALLVLLPTAALEYFGTAAVPAPANIIESGLAYLFKTSLANLQPGYHPFSQRPNETMVYSDMTINIGSFSFNFPKQYAYIAIIGPDLLCLLVATVSAWLLKLKINRELLEVDGQMIGPDDYSVRVHNLPKHITAGEIKQFFEDYLQCTIHQV